MRERVTKWLGSLYVDVPALRPGTPGACAFAVATVAIATALRLAVDPYVIGSQFVTFWPAIIITTLVSGFGAGFLCAVLSTAAVDFFFLMPRFTFSIAEPGTLATLLLFGPLAFSSLSLVAFMRSAIERRQIEASKDRLQLALDSAKLGWWRFDPSGRTVAGDARFKEIFDLAADEIPLDDFGARLQTPEGEQFLPDRAAASERGSVQAPAQCPAQESPAPHEYRITRRDGAASWVEMLWLAHQGSRGDGADSVVGTVRDITGRKLHEERERLLMREVNHRSKNMLSVVDAIARQTSTKDPEEFIARLSERIQALSANQDLLINGAWHGVEIPDLVRAQLAPFADLFGSRICPSGARLRLNAGAAQAIGLALHELATNAGKYGALSTDSGRLEIRWWTEGGTLTMSWTERGGPKVTPPQRRGFGTIVMREMVERSMGGKVDLEYAPCGMTWRLTCPAADALESVSWPHKAPPHDTAANARGAAASRYAAI